MPTVTSMPSSRLQPHADRVCRVCGGEALDSDRFCADCGASVGTSHRDLAPPRPRRRLNEELWQASPAVGTTAAEAINLPNPSRRRRRRRRRWYRRPRVMVPLAAFFLLLASAGGGLLIIEQTLGSLQTVSTPRRVVSGDAFGGDSSVEIDTSAARAIVGNNGDGGIWSGMWNTVGNVQELAHGAAAASGLSEPPSQALDILIMGVDARPGEPIDISVSPDAIMVLHLDPDAGNCRILAVPRDTRTELPGYGKTKVNHALLVGGIPYQQMVVEQLLGIEFDSYALIDFTGYERMVDALGGVTVTIPKPIVDSGNHRFEAGTQVLDGERALRYVRFRGDADHDIGRIERQQQVIRSMINVASDVNPLTAVNDLLPPLRDHIRTDISPDELVAMTREYRSVCTDSNLELDVLQGSVVKLNDPLLRQPLYYNIVDEPLIQEKVEALIAQ
jgi:LCP family protein required for cell wall assembly